MMEPQLSCQELVELVTDYLEATLPPPQRLRFEEHLMRCAGCRAYLDQMRQTIAMSVKLSEETLDPEVRDALLHVFRSWKQS